MAARKRSKKKYPRRCCSKCKTMHRTYASAQRHKAEMGGSRRSAPKRRKAKTGFAAMSVTKRKKIARKGGRASARARGYR